MLKCSWGCVLGMQDESACRKCKMRVLSEMQDECVLRMHECACRECMHYMNRICFSDMN